MGPPTRSGWFFSDLLYQPWHCATAELQPEWLEVSNVDRCVCVCVCVHTMGVWLWACRQACWWVSQVRGDVNVYLGW